MKRTGMTVRGLAIAGAGLWLFGLGVAEARADDAKQLYEKHCLSCHGPSGKGDGPAGKMLKPPPPDLGTRVASGSEEELVRAIKEGGKAVGKSPLMPAFGSRLSDEQVKGLFQYMKGFAPK